MKTILVTGGAGFIGSHLIEELVRRGGSAVYSLDNYSTGKIENHIKGAVYITGDTADIETLVTVKPDVVFHLGEYSRVEKSFDDMPVVWRSNIAGTFAVLEFCRKRGTKIIYAGSSTKFADGGMGRDQSPYAWTKASNTELVRSYGAWFGLPYAITYFYNVYGGREITQGPYATLIGIFKEQYRRGEPLTVVSPGTQERNFTHIDDIVNGLILVGEKGEGDEYGLGSEVCYSVLEVAHLFGCPVVMLPERRGNRMGATVHTERVRREFGWQARRSLKEHVEEYIASQQAAAGKNK